MKTAEERRSFLERVSAILQRPVLGPLLFGLVFGGAPLGVMFGTVDNWGWWLYCMLLSTPIAFVVSTVAGLETVKTRWTHLLSRAFIASMAACVPGPTIASEVMVWRQGLLGAYTVKEELTGLFALIYIHSIWAIAVTIPSWLLALGYTFFRARRTRAARQTT